MKSPITGAEMTLKREQRTMVFRKREYPVQYHFYFCPDSHEQFTTTALDEFNLIQVYNQYRDEFNLPFPEEIQATRELYGLSAAKMAEVLGLGINSYRNYEQGEVPNESNARLIQLARDPVEFLRLVNLSGAVTGSQLDKLKVKIENLILRQQTARCFSLEEYLFGSLLPDEYSGYKVPSLHKLREMVIYFADQVAPWKVKLNKLLFYADFLHFKKTNYSISGARYYAIPMGPVLDKYHTVFEYIGAQGDIRIETKTFDSGIGERFVAAKDRSFNDTLFSKDELMTLTEASKAFRKMKTEEMIDLSHKEIGWIKNVDQRSMISYQKYGFDLKAL
jgi:transcriptional regulator with XRE-family HTH domain